MGQLSAEERPLMGQLVNQLRQELEERIREKGEQLERAQLEQRLAEESIDVTLPGRPVYAGSSHSLSAVVEQIEEIFLGMGFKIAEGPEVETDYYNFEALNLAKKSSFQGHAGFFLYYGRNFVAHPYLSRSSQNDGKYAG